MRCRLFFIRSRVARNCFLRTFPCEFRLMLSSFLWHYLRWKNIIDNGGLARFIVIQSNLIQWERSQLIAELRWIIVEHMSSMEILWDQHELSKSYCNWHNARGWQWVELLTVFAVKIVGFCRLFDYWITWLLKLWKSGEDFYLILEIISEILTTRLSQISFKQDQVSKTLLTQIPDNFNSKSQLFNWFPMSQQAINLISISQLKLSLSSPSTALKLFTCYQLIWN